MNGKSEAFLLFERSVADLQAASEAGEISGQEMIAEYRRLRDAAMKNVTPSERAHFQKFELDTHRIGAEVLAEQGMPVPGNDPKKPN